ncbi:MAG TPA: hypothetical protein VGJ79_03605 [Candidatus Dormibacteraeota bacterium]|jgi:hypothetical protein
MAAKRVKWRDKPQAKDFDAAADYLRLILPERKAAAVVAKFRRAKTIKQLPKDIERASGLRLLTAKDPEVDDKLKKLKKGEPLSPILLIRGSISSGMPATIADGYHRVCAAYIVDQAAEIPCRLVDLS